MKNDLQIMMKLNHYEWDPKVDLIAEGAFAEVFKARDSNHQDRFVALKIYKEGVAKGTSNDSIDNKYSLEKEFQQVDGLSHTNIISYFGLNYIQSKDALGRSASYPVIIMEYASEGTLLQFLRTNPNEEIIDKIIRDIIEGVSYLHREGTIHRDLKPGNILITKNRHHEPVAKITDFGISEDTIEENLEQSLTEGIGTPHYMAPEQFYRKRFGINGEISPQTDIWAIGIIIYRILAGKRPFGHHTKDYETVRNEIINETPDYSLIPPKYLNLIRSCLEKKAIDRPNSAKDLLKKVGEKFTEEEDRTIVRPPKEEDATIIAPPTTNAEQSKKRKGNNKTRLVILAALVVAVVATGVFLAFDEEEIVATSEFAVIRLNNKFGYIDREGEKVIPAKYDGAWAMSEGLGLVQKDGKWGFIDKNGEVIIPLKYEDAQSFSEGLAAVEIDNKWGYINKEGEINIIPEFDAASSFSQNLAPVKRQGKWGYINKDKEVVIPFNFDAAYPFSEDLAVVRSNNKEGFINKAGSFIIPPKFDYALPYSENLAGVNINNKWGFIDKTGNQVIPPQYDHTWGFSENLAPVLLDQKWGYIDKTGALSIGFKYEEASRFSNGLAGVRLNEKEGYIDKEEKIVIPFSYDYTDTFSKVGELKN